MIDIQSIFKNKTPDSEKLIHYGFALSEGCFSRDFPIMNGQYSASITITPDGKADFKVYESDSGEEYMPAHVYNAAGAFVGEVHKACEEILNDIAQRCYHTDYFKWDQSKRILRFIKNGYNAEPEFLWSSLPECAALRVPGKKPWFAVIGRVPKAKFGLDEDGVVEVINLTGAPEIVSERAVGKNYYPAYHMNKQHWYTLFLDEKLSDDKIFSLIQKSYTLVNQ